jgi:class 3 adenylate cyclase
MDRHEFNAITAEDAAQAHVQDIAVQDQFGVRFLTYWFDDERQTAFCLAKAPNAGAVEDVHRATHGFMAYEIIEVDPRMVEMFMGGIVEHAPGEPYVATAFRTILFTDIEGSTRLTQELGDARAMAVQRDHDRTLRESLARHGGSEVKHTGDGMMASFPLVSSAIECAIDIQRRLAEAVSGGTRLRLRMGLSAGEPVTEGDDLFGATVQQAARLCARAKPETILVSSGVRDLAVGKGFTFEKRGRLTLKGFDEPLPTFEVLWQTQASPAAAGRP